MSVKLLLIADFTVSGIVPLLRAGESPSLQATLAPFDSVVPVLLDETADCWRSRPEIAVVWTRPDAAIKSFARILNHERVPVADLLADVDQFADCLCIGSRRVAALFVPSWTWPSYDRGLGVLNLDSQVGPAYWLMRMNARLIERVSVHPAIHVLDAGRWVAQCGPLATNPKLWHLGKISFGPEVLQHAATDIKAACRALKGQARKILVVDLDDTLWGGVVGDVGWENVNLGGHHPIGEAFRTFQRALKRLTSRGIVLAIVSKNTEEVALEAIDRHQEMVLRRGDFAGWRINWDDKVQNLIALSNELNLGLEHFVFVDDHPAERSRVREALPQVFVPEWPSDPLLYEAALAELTCFDALALTAEDEARSRMYVSERERKTAQMASQSLGDYLLSLGLKVTVEPIGPANIMRATQLLNKTNQMNLSTRRKSDAEFLDWVRADIHNAFAFRVSDRFGDYGLTGIASLSMDEPAGRLSDFVLSCRVIGRGVEEAMLHVIVEQARARGVARLVAHFVPTERNAPCRMFFEERSGFARSPDGVQYVWDLTNHYPVPKHVAIRQAPDFTPVSSAERVS